MPMFWRYRMGQIYFFKKSPKSQSLDLAKMLGIDPEQLTTLP
jgi:hypothetical protein